MSASNKVVGLWQDVLQAIENRYQDPIRSSRFFIGGIAHEPKLSSGLKKRPLRSKKILRKNLLLKYSLGETFPKIYLTAREADCMALLLHHYSNQQVAIRLNLSIRTVEFYIKNMRQKLTCHSKIHLIETIRKTNFMEHVDEIILRFKK